jgi:tight adherence protein C
MSETWLLLAFFGVVMALVTAGGYFFLLRPAPEGPPAETSVVLRATEPELNSPMAVLLEMFRELGEMIPGAARDAGALQKQLTAAGYRSGFTVPVFGGLRCAGALLLALVTGWTVFVVQESAVAAILPAAMAVAFGYTLPDRILRSLIKARMGRIRRSLPDALDLIVLSLEAGQSLDQALLDASFELKRTAAELSSELAVAHMELRAGTSRAQALRNLAARNPEPEVRKLTNLLIQSDRFGTSLGPALRVHAKYLRLRFKQQAEEAARKISVKLLFPIFFLIFPSMLMVTAGPAVLQIFTQLLPMINGGD